ncbi:2-hydroxyacid dehydrogenase [Vulcanisaeta thermophila]|uniref:2-hydroxyacid dehydrogenase n=1 Tax=Vulcanisaeta thermophila TaxID=867917 RepID=UPI000852EACD|nr:2-hydroxyacid dehydrogenase [Vulcanisaeta thermophila]
MKTVLSTVNLPERAREALRGLANLVEWPSLNESERLDVLRRTHVLLCWCTREFRLEEWVRYMESLELIQTFSAGVDHLPFNVIPSNVRIHSNAGAYSVPVAEHAWALIMALAKGLHRITLDAREYLNGEFTSPRRISGATLLVLGTGGIGGEVARIGKVAFNTYNIGINRSGHPAPYFDETYPMESLTQVIPRADIVVLALPLNKYTRGLVTERELRLLKRNAIMVNVGRGDVVREEDLYRVLRERRDVRFGTDVWWVHGDREEIPPRIPLTELPNFLGTPHVAGGAQRDVAEYAMVRAVENVVRYLRGEEPLNRVDRSDYV